MKWKFFSKEFIIPSLFKEGIWALIGNIVGVLLNIFTVRIITLFISTENYGKANLTIGIFFLINSLIMGPLMVAHNRLYFDYAKKSLGNWYIKNFKRIIIQAICSVSFSYMIIATIFYLKGDGIYLEYSLPILLLAFITPFYNELTNYIEAFRQQRKLALVNNIQKLLYPVFVLLFIFLLTDQIITIILAQSLSLLIIVLFLRRQTMISQQETSLVISEKDELKYLKKEMFSFGWYLPLGFFIMWVLTTSDRYILEHFRSTTEVGIYALNYGLWSMPFLIINGWLEVWTRPHIYDKASKGEWKNLNDIIIKRLVLGFSLGIVIIFFIIIFSDFISNLLLASNYFLSNKVIFIIAFAHIFYILGYSILPIYVARKKLKINVIALILAASFNVILNILFIPKYGIYGAAFSTLMGYIIWVIILTIGLFKLRKNKI